MLRRREPVRDREVVGSNPIAPTDSKGLPECTSEALTLSLTHSHD